MNKINISLTQKKLIVYIILTIVTLAVFWQVNEFDFINLDDQAYVTDNLHIQSGITPEGFCWAFSTKYSSLWNPLVWLSFMFDYQLHGLNAGGYHLTNLILHILSALLLFWLFCRMTGAVWKSAFVAAVFALHPLHVESVAWVSERKDVLSAFFWMLTLCLYVYYTEKPAVKRYLLVLFSFICALMSKPMVITLPVVMILLDYWPLKRFELKKDNGILWQLKEKMPFFILSALIVIITLNNPDNADIRKFPLSSRLANAPIAFVTYLEKTFWPHDMSVFYPFPSQIPFWQVLGAALLIIFISAVVLVMIKRMPYLFTGWLWYSITIAPVLGIFYIADYAMADHYHYLPSIGIALGLAWGIPSLIKSEKIRKYFLFPTGIIFIIILSILTWQQCGYWKNSIAYWNHTLQLTKGSFFAHSRLGSAYGKRGQYQRAIQNFDEAIRIQPYYHIAYDGRGTAYSKLGQYQRAVEDYTSAIRLKYDYADAYSNRALVYLKQGDNISGCSDAEKACELKNCKILELAKSRGLCR